MILPMKGPFFKNLRGPGLRSPPSHPGQSAPDSGNMTGEKSDMYLLSIGSQEGIS